MGIYKGSATLTRYTLSNKLPSNFNTFLDERIKGFAFKSIEEGTEELSMGWVAAHDFMDTDFSYASYLLEPYVMLGLRIDRRRVSGSLLKKYHRLELQKALAMRGPEAKISRSDREELKEKARLDLLRRIPPASQVFDLCWDTQRGQLWLGTATGGVRELFGDLFRRCFEMEPRMLIPWDLARGMMDGEEDANRLDGARPLTLYAGEA